VIQLVDHGGDIALAHNLSKADSGAIAKALAFADESTRLINQQDLFKSCCKHMKSRVL